MEVNQLVMKVYLVNHESGQNWNFCGERLFEKSNVGVDKELKKSLGLCIR